MSTLSVLSVVITEPTDPDDTSQASLPYFLAKAVKKGQVGWVHALQDGFATLVSLALERLCADLNAEGRTQLSLYVDNSINLSQVSIPSDPAIRPIIFDDISSLELSGTRFHLVLVPSITTQLDNFCNSFQKRLGKDCYIQITRCIPGVILPSPSLLLRSVSELRQQPAVAVVADWSPVAVRVDAADSMQLSEAYRRGCLLGIPADALFLEPAYCARMTNKFGD